MNKSWSSGNFYLRRLSTVPLEFEDSMTMCTLSVQELQSALEATLRYAKSSNIGKAKIVIHRGTINISIGSSKEMSS